MTVGAKRESLFAACGVDEQGAPSADHFEDALPSLIPDTSGHTPDEDTRGHFEEPPREVAAQPRWAGG